MKKKILIAEVCHQILVEELEKAGYQCDFRPELSNEEVRNIIGDYYGLVVRSKVIVDEELVNLAKKLKFVARVGSGMELIDMDYAQKKEILFLNSPEGNRDSVAEHSISLMIALLKNIVKSDRELRQNIWIRQDNRGRELGNQTVALLGYGNTGSAVAQKLSGFNCRVLAYDKYKQNFGNKWVEEVELEQIFEEADVLSIHLPLTRETTYWIGKAFLEKFRKNIFLINTSRGEIVEPSELVECLKNEKVLGAALDVFEKEPLQNLNEKQKEWMNFFIKSERVILTPHTAGLTSDSYYKLAHILAQKIVKSPQLSAESHK